MAKGKEESGTPPYLPWVTFFKFLKQIKTSGIPTRIDSTVLKGRSGSDQSGIKTALRFMSLIAADDSVTPRFRDLISGMDGEGWNSTLAEIITEAYLPITDSVDLDNGTLGELQQAFSTKGNVTGSVRDKAVRFYLAACRHVGLEFSPHFGSPATANDGSRRTVPRTRRSRPGANSKGEANEVNGGRIPDNSKEVRFPLPGKSDVRIWLPIDLTIAEWDMLDTYLRQFIALSKPTP